MSEKEKLKVPEIKKKLGLSSPGKLELRKTIEGGTVRQSFSHGRVKSVTVEVKKVRTFKREDTGSMAEVSDKKTDTFKLDNTLDEKKAPLSKKDNFDKDNLSDTELNARKTALKKVSVIGAVNKPGTYIVNPYTTVSQAINYAGGLEDNASLRTIKVIDYKGNQVHNNQ